MECTKFEKFKECFQEAFTDVLLSMTDIEAISMEEECNLDGSTISVIIGTVGNNKGRILFQLNKNTASAISDNMNGEPLDDEEEKNIYLGEFVNTFCGSAITKINNSYVESKLRLTPPAIFAGSMMQIVTPNVQSKNIQFKTSVGQMIINIGFEGE